MELHLVPGLVGAAIGLADGACVPWLISLLPEPEPDPEPVEAADVVSTSSTDEEPKELYADIAATPGLAWRAAVATAAANALIAGALGWDWRLLYLVPLTPVLVALAVVDWRTRLLPLRIVWPATFATAALIAVVWGITRGDPGATADLVRAGWGFLVGFGSFYVLWFVHPRGLGFGDVRLGGLLGLALGYLGWGELLVGLYAGFLLGGVGGGMLSLLKVVQRRAFPFGPFMVLGALIGVLAGDRVWAALFTGG